MTSFLFVTWDGGGNVPPALGIAAELRRRGHTVRVLGHPQQRDAVTAGGLPFEPYRQARPWSATAPAGNAQWAWKYLRLCTDRAGGTDVAVSLRREPADVAVVDCMMLGAIRAAQDLGVRQVTLTHTLYAYLRNGLDRGAVGLAGRVKGLAPSRLWDQSALNLIVTLRELELAESVPANAVFTGPVWPPGAPTPAPHDADEPHILISLSSVYYVGQSTVLTSLLRAVADLPVRVTLTTGHGVDPRQLQAPANVEVHRFLPHSQILPRVRMVVGHAGHATTMQALAHDLPMVLIPMSSLADQPLVAKAVARAGAATVVNRSASPTVLRAAIEHMLGDGPHRTAAATIGRRLRAADGASTAAKLLEQVT
ncbi:nucleotide disphospho-sugar-binding domain-containing protein [Micromonospora sp. NPDC051296]|uniref:glycosyltransferase n=1 Tax=Micromonospora sp. NPDC051296 TaxID=3155046 RepID=UPI003422B824